MLICSHCGKVVREEDVEYTSIISERHNGIRVQFDAATGYSNCPVCGGNFVTATKCSVCGEWFDDEEEGLNVCEDCLIEEQTVKTALAIGAANMETVKINGFVKFALTEEQINEILCQYIKDNPKIVDHSDKVVDYCEEDRSYFADFIAEE